MEKTLTTHRFRKALNKLDLEEEEISKLVKEFYMNVIALEIINYSLTIKELFSFFDKVKLIEKISLYIFYKYSTFQSDSFKESLSLTAIIFEKLGKLLERIEEDDEKYQVNVTQKVIRCYLRSSIAYTLVGNIPNSTLLANKALKLLDKDNINFRKFSLYEGILNLLIRNFNYQSSNPLINFILKKLKIYFLSGNKNEFNLALAALKKNRQKRINTLTTEESLMIRFSEKILLKIESNSVWNILEGKVSNKFIKNLVVSRPPIRELWDNQKECLSHGNSFLNNPNLNRMILNFSTSGGKTLIAEIAIASHIGRFKMNVVYLAPTNSLIKEIHFKLYKRFKNMNINVVDSFENLKEINTSINIIVCTPEKMENMIRKNRKTNILDNISLIIFDEIHKINEFQRGWILESIIWFLKSHEVYKRIHFLLMSAIMDNGEEINKWFGEDQVSTFYIKNNWKPTDTINLLVTRDISNWKKVEVSKEKKEEGKNGYITDLNMMINNREYKIGEYISYLEGRKMAPESKRPNFLNEVILAFENVGPNLLFFNEKLECENFVKNFQRPKEFNLSDNLNYLIEYISKKLGEDHLLVEGLKKGILYHHASLSLELRESLEYHFKRGDINTIVSTTTLLEGVNLPINNFIYGGKRYRTQREINIYDLKNISGRAGRAYQNTYGMVIFPEYFNELNKELLNYEESKNLLKGSLASNKEETLKIIESENSEDLILEQPFDKTLLLFFNEITQDSEQLEELLKNLLSFNYLNQNLKVDVKNKIKKNYYLYSSVNEKLLERCQLFGLTFNSMKIITEISKEIMKEIMPTNNFLDLFDINKIEKIISKNTFDKILEIKEFKFLPTRRNISYNGKKVKINHYEFLLKWIDEKSELKNLKDTFFSEVIPEYRERKISEYIEDNIKTRLSRAFSIITNLLLELGYEIEFTFLSKINEYTKEGLNDHTELLLNSLGFQSRNIIFKLAEYLNNLNIDLDIVSVKTYLVEEIDTFDLKHIFPEISKYEVKRFISLTNKLKTYNFERKIFIFNVAGLEYHLFKLNGFEEILKELDVKKIRFEHDKFNYYDENAVAIYYNNNKLGYVPRKINEEFLEQFEMNIIKSIKVILIERDLALIIKFS